MIEYINKLNSYTATARTVMIPISDDESFMIGTLCQISGGMVTRAYTAGRSTYLSLEAKMPDDGKKAINCLRLEVGMILRSYVEGGTSNLHVGDHIDFACDTLEYMTSFATNGSSLEIIAIEGNYATVIVNHI